jgi:hypothetical protein
MLNIRCSRLPIIAQCPAAATPPAIEIDSSGPEARIGTAVHAWVLDGIAGKRQADQSPEEYAELFRAEIEEVGLLCRLAERAWAEVSQHFPEPEVEAALGYAPNDISLTGHTDLICLVTEDTGVGTWTGGPELRLIDFKTSRLDEDYSQQVMGYGFLGLQEIPSAIAVRTAIVRVRDQVIDWATYTRSDLEYWWSELALHLSEGRRNIYNPGKRHCLYCPRSQECGAKNQMVVGSIGQILEGIGSQSLQMGDAYDAIKAVEQACERARESLHIMTAEAGGTLDLGDGRELVLRDTHPKEISVKAGWDVLRQAEVDGLVEDSAALLEIGKTRLEKAIRAQAPPRQGAARIRQVMFALESAGAITEKTVTRLECRKKTTEAISDGSNSDATAIGTGATD